MYSTGRPVERASVHSTLQNMHPLGRAFTVRQDVDCLVVEVRQTLDAAAR